MKTMTINLDGLNKAAALVEKATRDLVVREFRTGSVDFLALSVAVRPEMKTTGLFRGAPPSLMGIPVTVSPFLPSWVTLALHKKDPNKLLPDKVVMLIRWNDDYREHLAERFRKKGWRAVASGSVASPEAGKSEA